MEGGVENEQLLGGKLLSLKKELLEAHRTDVGVINDATRIYRAAPVIDSLEQFVIRL